MTICPECSVDIALFDHIAGCTQDELIPVEPESEPIPGLCIICGKELQTLGNASMQLWDLCPIHGTRGAPR